MSSLCVVGFVYVEIVVPEHVEPVPGTEVFVDAIPIRLGGALNTASVARALGESVALAHPLGDGVCAPGITSAVLELGIEPLVWPVRGEPATSLVLHGARDRAFVSAADLDALAACPALPDSGWIHVAGLAEARALAAPLSRARAAGARVSVSGSWVPAELDALAARRDVPWDLLFLSSTESRRVAPTHAEVFGTLDGAARQVIITDGERGAALHHDGACRWIDPEPATVVDTTGAGDAFVAGFLAATRRGRDPIAAAAFANAVAARVLGVRGGVATSPSIFADLLEDS